MMIDENYIQIARGMLTRGYLYEEISRLLIDGHGLTSGGAYLVISAARNLNKHQSYLVPEKIDVDKGNRAERCVSILHSGSFCQVGWGT